MINEGNKMKKAQLVINLLNKCLDEKYLDALNSELDSDYVTYYNSKINNLRSLSIIHGNDDVILDIRVWAGGIIILAVSVEKKTVKEIFNFDLDETEEWISCENTLEKFKEWVANEN